MVTKSEISPQRKLGSLRNFRLFLIRYEVTSKLVFVKIRARTRAHEPSTRALAAIARVRVHGSCARVPAQIFTKKYLLITSYLMRKSLKFRKDPSFR